MKNGWGGKGVNHRSDHDRKVESEKPDDAYYQRKPTRCAGRQFVASMADMSKIPGFQVLRRIFRQSECVRISWVSEMLSFARSDYSSGAQTVNSKREDYMLQRGLKETNNYMLESNRPSVQSLTPTQMPGPRFEIVRPWSVSSAVRVPVNDPCFVCVALRRLQSLARNCCLSR